MSLSKEYQVKDLVIKDEYDTIDSNATIIEAAKKMKKLGIPDLVVVEKGTNKVLGVIADFDIVQNIVAEGKDPKTESVKSVMYIIKPANLETTVKEAFGRMRDLNVQIIPVIDNDKLVGVCSIQDCWSYIPDQKKDEIGFISVKNPNTAEFWFGTACALIAFLFGVIFPLIGVIGYFSADSENLTNFLGIANVRGGQLTFFLFDARGGDFIVQYLNLVARNGPIWILIPILSYIILFLGIFSLFQIIYTGITEARGIKLKKRYQINIPLIFIIAIVLQWIVFLGAFMLLLPPDFVTINIQGLIFSISSIVLMIAAMRREYVFRQEETPSLKKEG